MQNIEAKVVNGKLVLTIDLDESNGETKFGNTKIAFTEPSGRSPFEELSIKGQSFGLMFMLTKKKGAKAKAKPTADEDEDDAPSYNKGDDVKVKIGKKWVEGTIVKVLANGKLRIDVDDKIDSYESANVKAA